MKTLRILVADDHDLIRRGVKALLQSHDGWEVCCETRTGREAVARAGQLKPDVAILDISMPDLNGVDAAKRIRRVSPHTEILILSSHYSDQLIHEVLQVGVRGYVRKSDADRDLVIAVETLANHRPFFNSCATEVLLENFNEREVPPALSGPICDRLSSREREIIQLVTEGKNTKQIASSLYISAKTVETHLANIMRKLHLHAVTELVRYALKNQIIEA